MSPEPGLFPVSALPGSAWPVCSLALLPVARWLQHVVHLNRTRKGARSSFVILDQQGKPHTLCHKPFRRLSLVCLWFHCIVCPGLHRSLLRQQGRWVCHEWLRVIMTCLFGLGLGFSSPEEVYSHRGDSRHLNEKDAGWW